jgi:hypothetical protein
MDYARFNYVAQPDDTNIRFVRQLGPYDDYAIEWGYRYFPEVTSETEKVFLVQMVNEKSMDPMFMFGYNGFDPNTQTENIGDDPIKASKYGLKNLKIVAQNLDQWTTKEGQTYQDLEELYKEMIGVYRRYVYHVIRVVGGVNETLMRKGQENIPFKNVLKSDQLKALNFLDRNLWTTQNWLMDKNLLSKLKDPNALEKMQALQRAALNRMLSTKKLNSMLFNQTQLLGEGLSPDELISLLYQSLFEKLQPLDDSIMALQSYFTSHLQNLKADEKLNPRIIATVDAFLDQILKKARKKRNNGDQIHQNHFESLIKRIKSQTH